MFISIQVVFLDDPTMTMNLQLLLPPLNKIFLLFNSHNFRENNNLYIHYTTTLCDFYVYQNIKTYVTQCAIPCSTVSWFIKRRSNFQTFIYLSLNDSIYIHDEVLFLILNYGKLTLLECLTGPQSQEIAKSFQISKKKFRLGSSSCIMELSLIFIDR